MGAVTRVNGLQCTAGTLYGLNSKLFKVTVKNTGGSAQNIQGEDDAVNEVVEQLVKEINPLAFFVVDGNGGVMHIVTDVSQSAAGLQHRLRLIGGSATSSDGNITFTYAVSSVGPNNIDCSGTTVENAATFTTTT